MHTLSISGELHCLQFSAQGTFLAYATSTLDLTFLRTDPWDVRTQTTVGSKGTGSAPGVAAFNRIFTPDYPVGKLYTYMVFVPGDWWCQCLTIFLLFRVGHRLIKDPSGALA